jgi:hypothetical protein
MVLIFSSFSFNEGISDAFRGPAGDFAGETPSFLFDIHNLIAHALGARWILLSNLLESLQ